ncbi:uvrD/REP helicase [Bacteroides intestinalis CAG:315]|uniref:DNA 3'-5' helicase n=1 Tax=Bacteroides intestinalis TaxID=329854 RepID=A0A412Y4U6_9BACE|nr:UvrD-helicase domain-containing protein [Bacteroides intestinalis]RGV52391.1 ATP-dependent helicase [Bacteroides intestinalis]RHA58909.1 ATP-dependent helicase [Bacteroides intestinalis]CDD96199.1 uvrD/REP helicase [Bacteroides intestinalis CAG:315]
MELLVYKASAGSGKTFTLAVEYIKHLILNPRAYRQILAVTFTNKATAEMKERILQQLYGIWVSDPASEPYLNRIREDLQRKSLSEDDIRLAAGTALQYMLHDYSRFRVETIDSFFQSVMRNLARELELSPNLNIELNNTEVLSDAVDSLIEKLTPSSPVLAWLLDYINERIADDKRWNVSNEIKRFGWNIFDEGYIEQGEGLRQQLKDPNTIKLYRNELREMETEALEQMKGFYDQFIGELEAHALTPEDLKGGARGIGSYFRKLRDGRLSDKDTVNATLKNSLDDAKNWATKTSAQKNEIIRLAETSLLPLLQDAETFRPRNNKIVNSCRLSLQHLNKLQLLAHIDEEVRELNREHNRFLLSDTNALLHNLVRDGDSSFVFEKIGANIRNVMIDEFQDTSRMQWDNFKILLLEGLSQGADSLIVGDVKQSIYRWRNGDWGILNTLGTKDSSFPFPVRVETLKTNRRSETNVIRFNNNLFTAAVEYLNMLHLKELQEDCHPLQRAYADVAQESPRTEAKGYIKATFLEPDEEHDYTELTIISLGEEVQRLLEAGVKLNDITILVRKNKNIPPIADYFDKTMHLPVVSDEAFRLDASQAICMLIDALRYLSNPEDKVACASLMMNYELGIKKQGGNWDSLLTAKPEEALPVAFVTGMETLRLMPLYELLEELFSLFDMKRIEEQDAYLFSFFDAVTEYLQNNSSDLDAFIRYWNETLCNKTIPSGEMDGIRILSIHKSKGLEFHTVLIPFCDWKLENETNNQLIWCSPTEAPFSTLDIVPVNYSSTMAESVYRQNYLDERLQLWVDNLNLLYVAFTRAGKNLIFWCKKGQKGTMSELLANALPQVATREGDENWDEEEPFENGELCPSKHTGTDEHLPDAPKVSANRLAQKPDKLPVHMESMRHDIEFRQSNRSADFIQGVDEEESDNRFINRGRLLHTLFSAIETEEDIDNAIDQLVFEGIIGKPETEEKIRELTHHAFSLPQVQDWYSGSWHLFNECDIIWQERGELRTRRPDRVMMRGNEIVVIDFKFGKQNKKYNKQVQGYMQLLTRMGYLKENIEGYLWYVEEDLIEKV